MNQELQEELTDAIKSLYRAGWTTGKIATALSAYDSFGLRCTSDEIKMACNTILPVMNARIRARNAEVRQEVRRELGALAQEFGGMVRGGTFNLTSRGVTVRVR